MHKKWTIALMLLAATVQLPSASAAQEDGASERVEALAAEWAHLNYEAPSSARAAEAEKAMAMADAAVKASPGNADLLVWDAIITSTAGGVKGGLGALGLVKNAKAMLEKAERIDPNALSDGSVYTSLGSLYYQVPGFPLGFGDKKKARAYLERAVAINPTGIDPNYFYGDFLFGEHDYAGAVKALERAKAAPPRPNRAVADRGRMGEVSKLLAAAQAHLAGG